MVYGQGVSKCCLGTGAPSFGYETGNVSLATQVIEGHRMQNNAQSNTEL